TNGLKLGFAGVRTCSGQTGTTACGAETTTAFTEVTAPSAFRNSDAEANRCERSGAMVLRMSAANSGLRSGTCSRGSRGAVPGGGVGSLHGYLIPVAHDAVTHSYSAIPRA